MFLKSRPALTLAFSFSLLLAGCDSLQDAKKAMPGPLQKPEVVAAHNVAAALPIDNSEKIARLQQQVADLQKEVSAARPKIAKIDVMEQKFKDLSLGLDRIDATYNMKPTLAPVPTSAPVPVVTPKPEPVSTPMPLTLPVPATEKPVAKTIEVAPPKPPEKPAVVEAKPVPKTETPKTEPAKVTGGKVVKDLRIGEKPEFSRLVLDLGEPVKVTYDIDNDEKILVVDIPGYTWEATKSKAFPSSVLIASYQVTQDEKGAHLIVQLKKPAKIANYSNIAPTGGKMARAVLDVAGQ